MTLPRIWSRGVASMPVSASGSPMLSSANAAALDAAFQQSLDKGAAGSSVYGVLALAPGASITLDSPTSSFFVNNNASTSSGGRFQCGHGDYPVVTPPLSLAKNVAMTEMMSNIGGNGSFSLANSAIWPVPIGTQINWKWFLDPSGSAYGGTYNLQIANSAAVLPLTRIHDGATLTSVTAKFIVSSSRTVLPGRYPAINVLQYDPFLNVTTSLSGATINAGWVSFAAPANIATYKNSGAPNTLTATISSMTPNVGKYLYFLALLDEDYASEVATNAPNEWLGAQIHVTASDLHFQ